MNEIKKVPHLKLIVSDGLPKENSQTGTQFSLFPYYDPSLLAFLNTATITGDYLRSVLDELRPRWVFDLRTVPRFNLGATNRKLVFQWFKEHRVEYRDMAVLLQISCRRDASINAGLVAEACNKILGEQNSENVSLGPLLFLLDDDEELALSRERLPKALRRPKQGWDVHVLKQCLNR